MAYQHRNRHGDVYLRKSTTQTAGKLADFTCSRLETAEDVQRAVDEATSHANTVLSVHVDWAPTLSALKSQCYSLRKSLRSRHEDNQKTRRARERMQDGEDFEVILDGKTAENNG